MTTVTSQTAGTPYTRRDRRQSCPRMFGAHQDGLSVAKKSLIQSLLEDVLVCDLVLMALLTLLFLSLSTEHVVFFCVTCPCSFWTKCHANLFVNNNNYYYYCCRALVWTMIWIFHVAIIALTTVIIVLCSIFLNSFILFPVKRKMYIIYRRRSPVRMAMRATPPAHASSWSLRATSLVTADS